MKRLKITIAAVGANSWHPSQIYISKIFGEGQQLLLELLNIITIINAICYTMLCILEWMRKGKHKIGTPRTQELRGSALKAYIHEGIP